MEFIGTRVQTSVQNVSTCELQKSFRENLTQWEWWGWDYTMGCIRCCYARSSDYV